jgi:hypothetical protein
MEDATCHNPLNCNLLTQSLLPFPRERERERERIRNMNQEAKDDFFAKTTAIAECMSA